jgi:anti-anti-sigma factor
VSQGHDVYEPSDFPASEPVAGRHGCHFTSETHDQFHVVRVVGSLDWATEAEFLELIRQECTEPVLIVDLTAGRIDAAGTAALALATEQAKERRQQLVLVATDPMQLGVMISTGLNIVVPVVSSEEEAMIWCERNDIPT